MWSGDVLVNEPLVLAHALHIVLVDVLVTVLVKVSCLIPPGGAGWLSKHHCSDGPASSPGGM